MYKLIFAFLCGFFTYGIATRVVPNHAPLRAALAAPAAATAAGANPSQAVDRPLPGVDGAAGSACDDGGRPCAWAI